MNNSRSEPDNKNPILAFILAAVFGFVGMAYVGRPFVGFWVSSILAYGFAGLFMTLCEDWFAALELETRQLLIFGCINLVLAVWAYRRARFFRLEHQKWSANAKRSTGG